MQLHECSPDDSLWGVDEDEQELADGEEELSDVITSPTQLLGKW
jgi:non-ribosomal peptide synthetase component E (peptide arylation enzyme)